MGDIVAAEPVSRHARATFPHARIVWIVRAPYRTLPDAYPGVDGTVAVQCLGEWLLLWSFGAFDAVWGMHLSERPCLQCGARFKKTGAAGSVTYETYYDLGSLLAIESMSAGLTPLREGPHLASSEATVAE